MRVSVIRVKRIRVNQGLGVLAICDEFDFLKMSLILVHSIYRKVASCRLSWLVAHPWIFRRLMKGKFDVLAKKF